MEATTRAKMREPQGVKGTLRSVTRWVTAEAVDKRRGEVEKDEERLD